MNPMKATPTKTPLNLWPHAIIVWFIVFSSAIAAWITIAQRQRMDLVQADYYEAEVRYQTRLEEMNRASAIRSELTLRYDAIERIVTLTLPASHREPRPEGQIKFYRPSDATLDFQVALSLNERGVQSIPANALRGGLWKVRAQWKALGKDYFFEQVIVVDEPTPRIAAAPPTGH